MEELLKKVKPLTAYLSDITKDFETRGDKPKLSIESLPDFNEKIWGLRERELVVLGGRPSNGKSALAVQIAVDIAQQDLPVLFLSLETTVEKIQERLFCNLFHVINSDLQRAGYKNSAEIQDKWKRYKKAVEDIQLLVTCGVGSTYREVIHLVELLNPAPKVVIVDYIQTTKSMSDKRRNEIDEYTRQFRQLAIEKQFCGVLVSQVNRSATQQKDSVPNMAMLKESGVLEEHADLVVLCHFPFQSNKDKDPNVLHLMVEKSKDGPTGTHPVYFRPEFYKFREFSDNEKTMHGFNKRR